MTSRGEAVAFTAILGCLAAVFLAEAWGLESAGRLGPMLVAGGVLALILFQLVRDIRGTGPQTAKSRPDEMVALGWVVALIGGIWLLGCVAAIGLNALLYVRLRGGRSWALAALWALLTALPVYGVSVWMLRPEMWTGALWSWP